VRGDARAEAQDVGDQVGGKFAAMALGESGEIGGRNLERGSCRAVSFGVQAVAGGAILLEHGFAGWDEVGGDLVLTGSRFGLRAGGAGKQQQRRDENGVTHREPPERLAYGGEFQISNLKFQISYLKLKFRRPGHPAEIVDLKAYCSDCKPHLLHRQNCGISLIGGGRK